MGGCALWYSWDTIRSTKLYWWAADKAMPLVRRLDPETAHHAGVLLEKFHLGIIGTCI